MLLKKESNSLYAVSSYMNFIFIYINIKNILSGEKKLKTTEKEKYFALHLREGGKAKTQLRLQEMRILDSFFRFCPGPCLPDLLIGFVPSVLHYDTSLSQTKPSAL